MAKVLPESERPYGICSKCGKYEKWYYGHRCYACHVQTNKEVHRRHRKNDNYAKRIMPRCHPKIHYTVSELQHEKSPARFARVVSGIIDGRYELGQIERGGV